MASQTGPGLKRASPPHNACSKTRLTCRTPAQAHHRTPASCACIVTLSQSLTGPVCDEEIAILTCTGHQHAMRAVSCLRAASKAEHDVSSDLGKTTSYVFPQVHPSTKHKLSHLQTWFCRGPKPPNSMLFHAKSRLSLPASSSPSAPVSSCTH